MKEKDEKPDEIPAKQEDSFKNPDIPLDIRDLRGKDKFVIDDKFLNGFAREVGVYGVGVYVCLCRHADKEQTSWPSIKLMGKELNISRFSVMHGLKNLEKCRIIKIKRLGKTCTNRYALIDKRYWRHKKVKESEVCNSNITLDGGEVSNSNISGLPQQHHQVVIATSSSKDTQERIHKKGMFAANAADWDWKKEWQKMNENPDRAVHIIAIYLDFRSEKLDNSDQVSAYIKRYARSANSLKGFSDDQILRTMVYLSNDPEVEFLRDKWNLDTIFKYIVKINNYDRRPKFRVPPLEAR